jgi:XTP/dITP diphosphohydrolase
LCRTGDEPPLATIVVATRNAGKVKELSRMLGSLEVRLLTLDDLGIMAVATESGRTFTENAIMKAEFYAKASGRLTLADDSGLEVEALEGQPGVHTARFGGPTLTPEERYEYLLKVLEDRPWPERKARFRSVVALANGLGLVGLAAGACPGVIGLAPAGEQGFGYDPVFYFPQMRRTMAQLSPAEKDSLSHRGRAMRALAPLLRRALDESRT